MGDSTLTTELGNVLVTGGSGFVGANLVSELLDRGHQVRSFDRAPSPLAGHPRMEVVEGDICDADTVAAAVDGRDTRIHHAATTDLVGAGAGRGAFRLHGVQQCRDGRPAHLRRRRNTALYRAIQ